MKKIFSLFIVFLILIGFSQLVSADDYSEQCSDYDLDCNGVVEVKEDIKVVAACFGIIPSQECSDYDYKGDNVINILDLLKFSSYISQSECEGYFIPHIITTCSENAIEDVPYICDVDATGSGQGILTYQLHTWPAGMTIDADTGLIQWTPDNFDIIDPQEVTVKLYDGDKNIDTYSFIIMVEEVNDAPIDLVIDAPASVNANRQVVVRVEVKDEDSDRVNITINDSRFSKRSGLGIIPIGHNGELGTLFGTSFEWQTSDDDVGNHIFSIIVDDEDNSISKTFIVEVVGEKIVNYDSTNSPDHDDRDADDPQFDHDAGRDLEVIYGENGAVSGYYILDKNGAIHERGNIPLVSGEAYWSGDVDIARALEVVVDHKGNAIGGYVLDLVGGIHPFGEVPALTGGPYWGEGDITADLEVVHDKNGNVKGAFVLDRWGAVHATDGVAALGGANLPEMARDLEVVFTSNGLVKGYYILDIYGGIHNFGNVSVIESPFYQINEYVPVIARDLEIVKDASGNVKGAYVLDAFGGVHATSGLPDLNDHEKWYNTGNTNKVGLSVVQDSNGNVKGYYVLDSFGEVDSAKVRVRERKADATYAKISSLRIVDEIIDAGEDVIVSVHVESEDRLEKVKAVIVIPELGIRRGVVLDDDSDDELMGRVMAEIPEDTEPGEYDVRITISNDNLRRVKHRVVVVE